MASTSIFVILNLLSGVFNYLFQMFASIRLSAGEYAQFNLWLAQLSMVFTIGGIIQYASSFSTPQQKPLQNGILFINTLGIAVAFYVLSRASISQLEMIAIGAISFLSFSWLAGQAQNRMMYYTLGILSLLAAGTKLTASIILPTEYLSGANFIYLLFFSLYPSIIFTSVAVWRNQQIEGPSKKRFFLKSLLPAFILSFAAQVFPQIDILAIAKIHPGSAFEDFVRATLFAKGVFFIIMIFAQWLLPKQLRSLVDFKRLNRLRWLIIFGIPLLALFIDLNTSWVIKYILKWQTEPSALLIFLTCWNMGLLSLIYLFIQEFCTKEFYRPGILVISAICIFVGLQMMATLPIELYFACSIVFLHVLVLRAYKLLTTLNPSL